MRAGLESVVRSNCAFEFAGALTELELEARLDEITADVVLLELPHPDDEALTALSSSPVPIVLLTSYPDAAMLRGAIRGILPPDATSAEIAAALQSSALGLVTMPAAALETVLPESRPQPPAKPGEPPEELLSPREREVLALLAEGLSNKAMAYRLSISEHTVKFHVTSIMGKLRAGSRTDAVMQGIRRGLVLV